MARVFETGALVVGLGNPGAEYARTRHNFGFFVIDELFGQAGGISWQEKFKGAFCRLRVDRLPVTLLKPMTYMNRSGSSVARAAQFFDYSPPQIIVVHDEVDLEFGTVRVKCGGGTAGHKGLISIKQQIGNAEFIRVRMGIGRPVHGDVSDYVLSRFSTEQEIILMDIIGRGVNAVTHILTSGATAAMNEFNKRGGEANES